MLSHLLQTRGQRGTKPKSVRGAYLVDSLEVFDLIQDRRHQFFHVRREFPFKGKHRSDCGACRALESFALQLSVDFAEAHHTNRVSTRGNDKVQRIWGRGIPQFVVRGLASVSVMSILQ